MSYNIEQPITGELASAKANKGGDDITNPATWRTNLDVPNTLDSRRRSFSGGQPGVEFDGATASSKITSVLTAQPFSGTGDFGVWIRFRVPASNISSTSVVVALTDSSTSFAANNSFYFELNRGDGQLSVFKRSGANVSQQAFAVSGFQAAYAGQVVDLVLTRVAGAWKCYCNGTDITPGTLNYANEAVSFTYLHLGLGGAAPCWNDRIYRVAVFNRGLSAADVADLIVNGIADEDQWATQTALTFANGGFETDAAGVTPPTNWTASGNHVATVVADATVEGSKACEIVASAAGLPQSGTDNLQHASPVRVIGKRYRMTISARTVSGNTALQWSVGSGDPSGIGQFSATLTGSYVAYANEFVAISTSGNTRICLNGAGTFRVDNVRFERIGALVDLNLGEGAGLCFTDRSTNALHAIGTGGISHVVAGRQGCVRVRTTGTGNIQLGGTGIIPTNGRIRFITADAVSGTPTITMGSASGGAQHIPSIALAAGFNELSPVARFNTTGNLWVNVSATATVDWTVIYDLVD